MCGIIGYIGERDMNYVLVEGLKRLEYRGYDSAGIAVLSDNKEIKVTKCRGKILELENIITNDNKYSGSVGIGHTRWATHGRPSDYNAHPHTDCSGKIAVVHNGIIENFRLLKKSLLEKGHKFTSETDTEVIPHLIENFLNIGDDLFAAINKTVNLIEGAYACAIIYQEEADKIIAVRLYSPLVIGLGKCENFIASDIPAILNYTKQVITLDDRELAVVKRDKVEVFSFNENISKQKEVLTISWDILLTEKAGYDHFMLKEIHEQPTTVLDTLRGRLDIDNLLSEELDFDSTLEEVERIYIVGCGTAYHAGMVAKQFINELCRIPTEVDLASEFRYKNSILDKDVLVLAISQSGETADTLAAAKLAKACQAPTLAICNVLGSSLTRVADRVLYTRAGYEIGVASTKAFSAQLVLCFVFALHMAKIKNSLNKEDMNRLISELIHIPTKIKKIFSEDILKNIQECARKYFKYNNFLYLGRGINYPIALEGALKLKEISYIHAEGYAGGEMKHGPIALIDENMPTVAIITQAYTYPKMFSNIMEIKSRDGQVIAIATEGDENIKNIVDYLIYVPQTEELLSPIINTISLQLLAYYIARKRGCDVDKPRNLAKSVTVE